MHSLHEAAARTFAWAGLAVSLGFILFITVI
jgi:hypothetical protein